MVGSGAGACLRLRESGLDLGGRALSHLVDSVCREPVQCEPGGQAPDGVVALGKLFPHPRRHVPRVVVPRVPVHSYGERLDRLRAVAVPRPLDRGAHRVEHRQSVRSVDALGGDRPSSIDPLGDIRVDHLAGDGRRVRVAIRLDHEHRRHLPDGGEIEPLVGVSDGKRTLTEERHRDAALAPSLERQGSAGDERDEIPEHRDEREHSSLGRSEMHVAVSAEGGARCLAEEVAEDVCRRRAAREVACELPVEGGDDVFRPEREPCACRNALLAATRVDGARNPTLTVESHHAILEQALEEDEAEQRDTVVRVDRGRCGAGLDRHQ